MKTRTQLWLPSLKKRFFVMIFLVTIAVVFVAQSQQESPLYALPNASTPEYVSNSIALSDNGRTLVSANMLNNSITIASITVGEIVAEVTVGTDPRSVALTPDNTRAVVVSRGDGTLSVIDLNTREVTATYILGLLPYGVISPTNESAFISMQGEDAVLEVDLNTGAVLNRIVTPDAPTGLAKWGDFLYVMHLWSGDVSLIYLPQAQVVRTVASGQDTGLLQSVSIDRTRGLMYLPQTRFNVGNRALTYDSTVFPVVNVLDLRNLGLQRDNRVTLDTVDRPVNMPFASEVDSVRNLLYVANAGSDDISVIDMNTREAVAHINVGANPRGIMLSPNGGLLYVHNMIDGTITTVETRNFAVTDVLPVSNTVIPVDVLIGAELFHTARDDRLDTNEWLSCATCHFDGQSDGRVWEGFAYGATNTPALYDLLNTAPYTWVGAWDEVADVELKIRNLQAGLGLIVGDVNDPLGEFHAGLSIDLDSLTAYLMTITGPRTSPSVIDPEIIARGATIFADLDCTGCHAGEVFTDGGVYDVGTDGEFNTPTLRWLWQSAPYLHDGRAETLDDVFTLPGDHQLIGQVTPDDIDALIAYLLSLPSGG